MRPRKKPRMIGKAQQLLNEGYTQEEVAEHAGISVRTQGRYLAEGILDWPKWKELATGRSEAATAKGKEAEYEWPDITAADLIKAGFLADRVPIIMASFALAKEQSNNRLARFLQTLLDIQERWSDMPSPWQSVIAGFPIVSGDIGAPSLAQVAALVRDIHPYKGKELRREYHRKAKPLLPNVMCEVQAFLQDAATAGGVPLLIFPERRKPKLWSRGPKVYHAGDTDLYYAGDLLGEGGWAFDAPLPQEVPDRSPEVGWAMILFDIISRLPDPDRPLKGWLTKAPLLNMLYLWCSTAPDDFKPPLSMIRRTTSGGHYKQIYMHWYEKATKGETFLTRKRKE